MKRDLTTFIVAILVAFEGPNTLAQGFSALVPSDSALEANSSTLNPFSSPSSRFQQVYLADNLTDFDPNAVTRLSSLVFRQDGVNGSTINGQMANFQVRMSTTPRAVDSLSPVFADNIGPDQTTVFSGTVQWFSNYVPGSQFPQALDLRIDLQQPFFYRPSTGNLLVDFTVNGTTISSQFDAWNRASDPVSSVFGSSGASSGTASTLGLVTYFAGTVVPEPTPFALALLGIVTFALMRRKRKQTKT